MIYFKYILMEKLVVRKTKKKSINETLIILNLTNVFTFTPKHYPYF